MANDNNYYVVSGETLSQFADALRILDGTSQPLEWPNGFGGALWSIAEKMVDVQPLSVTQNGTYTAPTGTAYSPVTVNVSGGGTDYLAARLSNTLTTYSSNDATSIPDYAFYSSNLQSFSFPNVKTIGTYAFYNCKGLTSVSFDSLETLGNYCFQNCSNLTTVNLPNLTGGLVTSCFRSCVSLTHVELNSNFSAGSGGNVFYGCTSLEMIDLKKCMSVASDFFRGCSKLSTVILRKSDAISSLIGTSAFTGTPFASDGSGGTLYVPNDLIASYQSASNWSTILGYANNQIKKIEGSIYE